MRAVRVVGIALAITVTGVACSGGGPVAVDVPGSDPDCPLDGGKEYPPDQRPSSTAEITIIRPKQGQVFEGSEVEVKIRVDGACILGYDAVKAIRPDTGHVHVKLGDRTLTSLAGDTYTIEDLEPNDYLLEVGFYAADHNNFNPPVSKRVSFTVTG